MANCDNLFRDFDGKLNIVKTKKDKLINSKKNLRTRIQNHFKKEHPDYTPKFWIQGSYKMRTAIRTKDDLCDLDDGVFFSSNPQGVTGTTLQKWVKEAVDGTTDATPSHNKKCITVDYTAGYNIDLPVFLFDEENDAHPHLAVKNEDFKPDDPKEFVKYFEDELDQDNQLRRIIKYLKAWCDYKRQKMPSGLAMTILALDNIQKNKRDDVALKFTLIEIEKALNIRFQCVMQTTPNEDIFKDYDKARKDNFLNNLSEFIKDAKKACDDEKNQNKASDLWKKHLGDRFPDGEDKDEKESNESNFSSTIGNAKPYYIK